MLECSRTRLVHGTLGAILVPLLIYASILPLEYVPLPWEQALERWKAIPWLQLGVSNRADWIANGLVVIPISYCLSGCFSYRRRFVYYHLGYYSMLILGMGVLVFGIEMLQAYFPRRTMSINDIVAGWLGAVLGVTLWFAIGEKSTNFLRSFLTLTSIQHRIQWIALVGCIGSVVYTLFPFDLVISRVELLEKISEGRIGIFGVSGEGLNSESIKGALSSFIRMIPFSVYLTLRSTNRTTKITLILIPLLLELIQIPIYSKYSSIVDWGIGYIGGFFGVFVTRRTDLWQWLLHRRAVWAFLITIWTVALYAIYVGVLPYISSRTFLVDAEKISQRWHGFFTPPFLRYYYPSEYTALTNFLGKSLTFAGLGILLGGFDNTFQSQNRGTKWKWLIGFLLVVCVSMELAQVYVEDQVADSTDILIYLFGGICGFSLFGFILNGSSRPLVSEVPEIEVKKTEASKVGYAAISLGGLLIFGGLCLAASHPGWPLIQCLMTILIATIVYLRWECYPFLFTLLLIIADAYPLTGQLVFQEYDSLLLSATGSLLVTGSVGLNALRNRVSLLDCLGWSLLFTALTIGLIIGAYRLPSGYLGDQLSVYFNGWNAVRVSKGLFWGLCFWYLSICVRPLDVLFWRKSFVLGLVASSWYVGIWIVVERTIFPGFFNTMEVYRATGPFFTMHIGDQHIDAFLVIAFPIVSGLLVKELQQISKTVDYKRIALLFFSTLLLCHGVFATMSRGPVLAVGVQSLFLIFAALFFQGDRRRSVISRIAILSLPILGLFSVVFYSTISSRFNSTFEDTAERIYHWSHIIEKGSSGIGGVTIGHGSGCFPSMMAIEKGYTIPPLRWESADKQGKIFVQSGWPIFLDRLLRDNSTRLIGAVRFADTSLALSQDESIDFYRVEKTLLHSYSYVANRIRIQSDTNTSASWPQTFNGDGQLEEKHHLLRPVYIGISSPKQREIVLSNSSDSNSLISERSSYPWMFTCDDHLVWRAKNFLVHTYYEQGLVGVLGWLIVLSVAFLRGIRQFGAPDPTEQALGWFAVSIIGFFIVGMFGTLIDTPWISSLILGCTALACQSSGPLNESA